MLQEHDVTSIVYLLFPMANTKTCQLITAYYIVMKSHEIMCCQKGLDT